MAGVRSVIELSKYIVEALGRDKDFNLYRATSKEGNSQILVLSPAAEYPPSETLERLEHEYSLREELDPAWAARPIETARYRDSTVLVLDEGIWNRFAAPTRTPICRGSRINLRDTRLHGTRADRTDEPFDRFPERSLFTRCYALQNADRESSLHGIRPDGMGPLPHCQKAVAT